MKEKYLKIKDIINKYNLELILGLIINLIFIIYNLYLGIKYSLIWNFSFSFYYLFLIIFKLLIILENHLSLKNNRSYSLKVFKISFIFIILLTLAMIGPTILMIKNERNVSLGTISAIAVSAYTFLKLGLTINSLIKNKNNNDLFVISKTIININQVLVAILTLQNTLIYVFNNGNDDLLILVIVSSTCILILMTYLNIKSLLKGIRLNK